MPAQDGRGPLGRGPMSGRGLGYCISATYEGNDGGKLVARSVRTNAVRRGVRGRGQGYRAQYCQTNVIENDHITKQEEMQILQREVRQLQSVIVRIEERIRQIEKEK